MIQIATDAAQALDLQALQGVQKSRWGVICPVFLTDYCRMLPTIPDYLQVSILSGWVLFIMTAPADHSTGQVADLEQGVGCLDGSA